MFSWLSSKNAETFGTELASTVMELVPNDASMAESKRLSKTNYAKDKMQRRIRQFKQEEVLNFFKTAKLLNTFKWALKDAGYDKDFIDSFASWIFIALRTQNF
jgi:hypothetical protein